MQQILEDIQGRLVYRMQAYIRTDIGMYETVMHWPSSVVIMQTFDEAPSS